MEDNNRSDLLWKYSQECWIEYDCKTPGHDWNFVNKKKWILVSNDERVHFTESAFLLSELFKNLEIDKERKESFINTPYLKWFLDNSEPCPCRKDYSMILNTIMKEQTFKPFEIMTSICDKYVTINIRGLPKYTPSWFYSSNIESLLVEFLLCRGKDNRNLKSNDINDFQEEVRFIRILHKCTPIKVGFTNEDNEESREENKFRVLLHIDSEIVKYRRGRVCGCVPIPGHSQEFGHHETCLSEPQAVKSPEIVVVSPAVSEALDRLDKIWQDTFAHTILISAPPGSGKEVLIKSIPYGNGRLTENENFPVMSMADCESEDLQRRLYGVERNDGVYVPGLIALAKGSALFLDEIHEPQGKPFVRKNLLRVLEAGEYFAKDGIKLQKVKNVLFVMATSKCFKRLEEEVEARDFWTRMTYAIEVKHPLDFSGDDNQKSYVLSRFFNYFWWMRIEEFYGMRPVFCGPPEEIRLNPNKLVVFWQVHSMTQIMGFKCEIKDEPHLIPIDEKKEKEKNFPFLFAEVFLENCKKQRVEPKDFSIRGIRSMITRLFSIAASEVARGQVPWYNEEKGRHDEENFRKDVEDAFKEIVRMACINQRNANVKSHNLR